MENGQALSSISSQLFTINVLIMEVKKENEKNSLTYHRQSYNKTEGLELLQNMLKCFLN